MSAETPKSLPSTVAPVTRPRRRWVTVLLALSIFGAGLVCGAGIMIVTTVHRLQYAIHHPEDAPARVANALKHKLSLDDQQRAQIESIIARRQVELTAIRREFQPKVLVQLEKIRDEIGEVLNPSQRAHWEKMFDELRERWLPPMPEAEKERKGEQKSGRAEEREWGQGVMALNLDME